jgi:phage protein D
MPDVAPVPGFKLLIDGTPAAGELMFSLLDVQVRDSTHAPDTAVIRFRDAAGNLIRDDRLGIGKRIDIRFSEREETETVSVFKGEIVALEPEFTERECIVAVRAYDLSWRLNRQRTSTTFQDVMPEDMIKQVAGKVGIAAGTVPRSKTKFEFFQQSMETDWDFCQRVARLMNLEFIVDDGKFHLTKRTRSAPATTLKWGDNLLAFKPRMSGLGQVTKVRVANRDPLTRQELEGVATDPVIPHRSDAIDGRDEAISRLGNQEVVIADRVLETQAEADEIAQMALDRLAGSFVEAEGRTWGDPNVRAGSTVKLENVGGFSGEYALSETTHRYSGGSGYITSFVISGRSSYALTELIRRDGGADWSSSLVLGIVSNNHDPKKMGRVRIKFPALGDTIESGWARVLTPNAGKEGRGMYYLPQIDDEVVVAFEHGDTRRPLVLGSLFNGRDQIPPELLDPSDDRKPLFGVQTPHEALVDSKQKMTLRSHETLIVEVAKDGQGGTGDLRIDAEGNVDGHAALEIKLGADRSITIDAKQEVTLKGKAGVTIQSDGALRLKGSLIDINASGAVTVKGSVINLG